MRFNLILFLSLAASSDYHFAHGKQSKVKQPSNLRGRVLQDDDSAVTSGLVAGQVSEAEKTVVAAKKESMGDDTADDDGTDDDGSADGADDDAADDTGDDDGSVDGADDDAADDTA